jgi:glucose/arabinose dehydrogenase
MLPEGFIDTQIGSTLTLDSRPTAMDLAPDGRIFVCVQNGQLRVIEHGTLLATPFVTLTVASNGDRGLLGIAFDPDFANNQFVYVHYTVPGSPAHDRISRFTANGNVAIPGSETAILDLNDLTTYDSHNGGAIHFGPDGKLYISVGENGDPTNSQTVDNLLGKMLRINSDGTIPPDNPTTFPGIDGSPTGVNRAIWAVGFRNPFTFAFQPGTGRMFINDVGQNTFEEINDGIAGSNYGWNLCEGACSPPNPTFRDPIYQYGHGVGNTSGCAVVGGAFYNPAINQFPADYIGKYFYADLCSGWIRLLDPSNISSGFATGITFPVDLKVGPDGSLYYLAQGNGGHVSKIQYLPTPAPTATPLPTPAQLLNISTRLRVETGDNVMIGGFVVTGRTAKPLLLRGMGPSLIASGVPADEVLLDPSLELRGSDGALLRENDNWMESPFRDLIKGTPYQPTDDREAVIVATVQPGAYTAILTGNGQTTGVALAEVYDIDQTVDSKLANISTRGLVQTGDNVMIGGFILGGNSADAQLAIRGIGPSLSQFGLSNVLADPTLELRDSNGTLLISNDNWMDDPVSSAQLTANGLALPDPHESGIVATLPPGAFTAILAGRNDSAGIGLVEIYSLQ